LISSKPSRVQKGTFGAPFCTLFRVYFGLPRNNPHTAASSEPDDWVPFVLGENTKDKTAA
jgi:hypothetical protein